VAERPTEIYCVDTSALIDLPLQYPRSVFGDAVWRSLDILVSDGRLRVPREVRRELGKQEGDEIYRWVRSRGNMVIPLTLDQQGLLREIMARYSTWVDHQTQSPVADPIVIALARSYHPPGIVVAHEILGGPGAMKIPNVCRDYGIKCIRLPDLFVREGWRFASVPPTGVSTAGRGGPPGRRSPRRRRRR